MDQVRPAGDIGTLVPLTELATHKFTDAELSDWNQKPVSCQRVSSSYVSIDGIRYHLHPELVQDETSCWLCSKCAVAKNHESAFCIRNVDYGYIRRAMAFTPSLLEECIARRSRPYRCTGGASSTLRPVVLTLSQVQH